VKPVRLKTSKVNEFRLWGLMLTMGGMMLMIIGLAGIVFQWGTFGRVFAVIFMAFGALAMIGSMAVYFAAGMLSTSAIVLECPECGKATKMIGKTDRCMFCRTQLSLEPEPAKSSPDKNVPDKPAPDHKNS